MQSDKKKGVFAPFLARTLALKYDIASFLRTPASVLRSTLYRQLVFYTVHRIPLLHFNKLSQFFLFLSPPKNPLNSGMREQVIVTREDIQASNAIYICMRGAGCKSFNCFGITVFQYIRAPKHWGTASIFHHRQLTYSSDTGMNRSGQAALLDAEQVNKRLLLSEQKSGSTTQVNVGSTTLLILPSRGEASFGFEIQNQGSDSVRRL